MKITYELDLNTFEAWSGAVETLNRIIKENKTAELEMILEDLYPDGMDETQLNDLLRFDDEQVYEWLGIRSESEIKSEIEEAKEELQTINDKIADLMAEFNDSCIGIADWERKERWNDEYKDDYNDLKEQQKELKERIADLQTELEDLY